MANQLGKGFSVSRISGDTDATSKIVEVCYWVGQDGQILACPERAFSVHFDEPGIKWFLVDSLPVDAEFIGNYIKPAVIASLPTDLQFDSMTIEQMCGWYVEVIGYDPVEDCPDIDIEEVRANCKEHALIERCGGLDTEAYQLIEAARLQAKNAS